MGEKEISYRRRAMGVAICVAIGKNISRPQKWEDALTSHQ